MLRRQPDLRMQLVDRAEIADFVLVDDFSGTEPAPCRSSTPIRTVTLDADTASPTSRSSFRPTPPSRTTRSMSIRCGSRSRTRPPCSPRCGRPTSGAKPPAPSASSCRARSVSAPSTMPPSFVQAAAQRGIARFPDQNSLRTHRTNQVAAGSPCGRTCGARGQAFDAGSSRHGHAAQALPLRAPADAGLLRWTFIASARWRPPRSCSRISIASTNRSTIRRCSRSASAVCSACSAASC